MPVVRAFPATLVPPTPLTTENTAPDPKAATILQTTAIQTNEFQKTKKSMDESYLDLTDIRKLNK